MSPIVRAAQLLMLPLVTTSNIVKECARYYKILQATPVGDITIKVFGSLGYLNEVRKFDYSILKINSGTDSKGQAIRRNKVQFFANLFFSCDMVRILQRLPDQFRDKIGRQALFIADICTFCGSGLFLNFYVNDPTRLPLLQDTERLLNIFINACWVASVAISLIASSGAFTFSVLLMNTSADFANAAVGFSVTRFLYCSYEGRYRVLEKIESTVDQINEYVNILFGIKREKIDPMYLPIW